MNEKRRDDNGRRYFFLLCSLIAALLMLVSCGYRMAGLGSLPGDIKTLAVNMLTNHTAESGLEAVVTNALIVEFSRRRDGLVVQPDRAEAILTGTITSLGRKTITRRSANVSAERTVTITITLTLTKADGKILWQKQNINANQSYPVNSTSRADTDSDLSYAIGQVAQRLAETVMRQLVEDF